MTKVESPGGCEHPGTMEATTNYRHYVEGQHGEARAICEEASSYSKRNFVV